ncbi:CASP8-associated protein 2 isoform X2 [Oncorhynchus kisutch]|uniref:CASP8-associated protein 2 isoform X2 n=1 Tax=Oncorhynchus kisutch TaxID=8019 RepID=UPI0009A00457|nr:CASP8-associated protein 2-like isoform X2 [Oncorhynchus kisutch]XP_031644588.1 CASP8-associated protein 2-like isoform X2 [Oncorhynchus kisutch]XP_031644591.1 CASP8-associated protein 2-like isoform X2 [Oncorhynchus kisutch]XP_031644595.1 CASP8-associated protein 2-like isoform X2 [Oncorhynchus kisutch]XP_031644601.1 CASP8-associated protein 2-like isoform X2 [Oncorhynchus kisutch]
MSSCPTAAWTPHCTLRAPRTTSTHAERTEEQGAPSWEGPEEGSLSIPEEKEEEDDKIEDDEEDKDGGREHSPSPKRSTGMEKARGCLMAPQHPLVGRWRTPCSLVPTPLLIPVCAKNISLTASGEKVILWTREADHVILTTCQQQGANQSTFQAISTQLGDKTLNEVSRRFRDLLSLFRTAAYQVNLEDETMATEQQTVTDKEQDRTNPKRTEPSSDTSKERSKRGYL